ncbi:MAG: sodium/proton-translocating pyrophosphatase, partial [Parachlamydiales bacterium]
MFEMFTPLHFLIFSGLAAIAFGIYLIYFVLSASSGTKEMQKIAGAIQIGANAYMKRQYNVIALVGIVIFLFLTFTLGPFVGVGFLIGAVLSGAAGFIGMSISVRGNIRTAEAAKTSLASGLNMAFKSGAITGFLVVGLALLGITLYYMVLNHLGLPLKKNLEALVALSFGASLISIFARLGGGIFTKGADVGADLVGKIEANIPEDDPRNPAVIADNVGDNVGDCAGMAADLFETYVVTLVGSMLLGAIFFNGITQTAFILLPLMIGAVCIFASILGTFFVRLAKHKKNIMGALYKGFIATGIFSAFLIGLVIHKMVGFKGERVQIDQISFNGLNLFIAAMTGLIVTGCLM